MWNSWEDGAWLSPEELSVWNRFWSGSWVNEGSHESEVFTLCAGWVFRQGGLREKPVLHGVVQGRDTRAGSFLKVTAPTTTQTSWSCISAKQISLKVLSANAAPVLLPVPELAHLLRVLARQSQKKVLTCWLWAYHLWQLNVSKTGDKGLA